MLVAAAQQPAQQPAEQPQPSEQALAFALQHGVITTAQYEEKLRLVRHDEGAVTVPQRMKAGTLVMDGKAAGFGITAGPFLDLAAAKQHVKQKKVVHGNNDGEWVYNTTGTKTYMHCNRHVDCQVQLCFRGGPGSVCIYVTEGLAHGLVPKEKPRKNSALSFEAAAAVKQKVEDGKKPKQIKEELQMERVKEAQQPGGAFLQRSGRMAALKVRRLVSCLYLACILPVSCLYLASPSGPHSRILIRELYTDTCRHVQQPLRLPGPGQEVSAARGV